MHISDGVLPPAVVIGSAGAAAGLAGVLLARTEGERIPRVALCTSFFFVASLVHVPLGPTSVHLVLNGLVGIIMGPAAFLPILFGLALQAVLFQHGGLTTIGANAVLMGLPAYAAWGIWRAALPLARRRAAAFAAGAAAGATAVMLSAMLLAAFLVTAGEPFVSTAKLALVAHIPVAVVEGIATGFVAAFVMAVEPGILEARHA